MKKRIIAVGMLFALSLNILTTPIYAIFDNDSKQDNSIAILDCINFDRWKKNDDEYLEDYIIKAVNNNYDIKASILALEKAKLNIAYTKSGQLPFIELGAAPAVMKMPSKTKTEGSVAFPIIANWEIDIFGKNWDKTKSARKLYQSTQFETAGVGISIVSMVATMYYNIVKLDKIIQIQKELVSSRADIYNIMKLSHQEGITSLSDLILAEKSYVLAQNEMLDYQKQRQIALNALAVLIGDSPENSNNYKRISSDLLKNNFEIPSSISSEIIINRPDYKALEKQLESAGIDVRVAKKEFLPTVNILGLITFLATSSASSINWKNSLSLASASANIPIFTGFARVANLKLNKNKYEQLLNQYQKTGLVSIQEVNDSLYNLKSDNEKLKNNLNALEIQNKDFNLANLKYDNGLISRLELLQQKENLLYMQKVTAQSKLDCYIDKISLYKTTGARI